MAYYDGITRYDSGARYDESMAGSKLTMKKIKLPITKLTLDEKLQFTQNVITGLTENDDVYPAPNPSVTALGTLRTNIVNKVNEIEATTDALALKYVERDGLELELDKALVLEAGYVQSASGGDEAKILSAGFSVRAQPAPVGPLPAPQDLHSNYGSQEGSVECQWDRVRGAASYIGECGSTPEGPWQQVYTGTATHFTSHGLIPGQQYWFRARAVGAAGPGPWSDPSTKRAT